MLPYKVINPGHFREFGWKDVSTGRYHIGYDFNLSFGTEIYSVKDGFISKLKLDSMGFGGMNPLKPGPYIMIRHSFGDLEFIALYGHIKPIKDLKIGSKLKEGDLIGTVDNYYDGTILVPHLHLAFSKDLNPQPPYGYKDFNTDPWEDVLPFLQKYCL